MLLDFKVLSGRRGHSDGHTGSKNTILLFQVKKNLKWS